VPTIAPKIQNAMKLRPAESSPAVCDDAIKAWRKAWEDGLSLGDNALYQFMGKDRIAEVHHEGSARSVKTEEIPVGNIYSDASGTVSLGHPDGCRQGACPAQPLASRHIISLSREASQRPRTLAQSTLPCWRRCLRSTKDDQP
jgi:hypothetical protein